MATTHSSENASQTIIAQFESENGEKTGPQLNIPKNISANQLETLLNQLLSNV
jgi:ribosome assembly protein 4